MTCRVDWGCFVRYQIYGYPFFFVVCLLGSELRIVCRHMHPICKTYTEVVMKSGVFREVEQRTVRS
jgi:hypothetical protein